MRTAANLLLALASLTAGVALCEAALRVFHPRYEYAAGPPQRDYHWRSKYRHPDTGAKHLVVYNNLGSRQHRDFSEGDLAEGVNLAFFGDSFTENRRLPVQYSFTEVLDFLLNQHTPPQHPRINVLNFGQSGTGPARQYQLYRGLAVKRGLRHVFYVHCPENDIDDLRDATRHDTQISGLVGKAFSPWLRALSRLHLTYLALDVWQRLGLDDLTPGYLHMSEPDALAAMDSLLRMWRQEVEANGGVFHVVLLPLPDGDRWFRKTDALASWDVVDLGECFDERIANYDYDDWHFEADWHWNEAGNMVAAHCLYRHLEGILGLPAHADAELARTRGAYYRAFHDSDDWIGRRWMPGPPWALPAPPADDRESRILARYLALREDAPAIQERAFPLRIGPVVLAKAMEAGEQVLRSQDGWNAHLSREHRLVVLKKSPCEARETGEALFMRVVPWSPAHLAIGERPQGFRVVESRFIQNAFRRTAGAAGGECVQPMHIGAAPVASVVVGERGGGGEPLWKSEFAVDPPRVWRRARREYRQRYLAIARTPPAARSEWNVHALAARRELALLKEPCAVADTVGQFFVRLWPADGQAVGRAETHPDGHVEIRAVFQNLDLQSVAMFDDKCWMTVRLPRWEIRAVWVGEHARDTRDNSAFRWQAKFYWDIDGLRSADAWASERRPDAVGAFDVYRRADALVYVREPCAEADTRHRFFLHILHAPQAEGDQGSRANLDFDFGERGARFDGKCVAVAPLPGPISQLHTGQFSSAGETWAVEWRKT